MALLAVAFVTWMVFWMARNARALKGELHAHVDKAAAAGAGAVAAMAFIAVSREGFETALFLWSSFQTTGGGWADIVGGLLGLATAIALGLLIYRGALRVNLATFFKWTGIALIVIAAGVFTYGIHELQEAGLLFGEDSIAFDISGAMPETRCSTRSSAASSPSARCRAGSRSSPGSPTWYRRCGSSSAPSGVR